jgi:hypothetical protein
MDHTQANAETRHDESGRQLAAGSFAAAFIALVFGACLWTALDGTRPANPHYVVSKVSASSQNIVRTTFASR